MSSNDILMNLLSKVDLLIVFIGMALLLWRVVHALDTLAQLLARQPVSLTVPPARPSPPPAPIPAPLPPFITPAPRPAPIPPPPAAPPVASGPFASYPSWFQDAVKEIGFRETGDNQGIERYIQMAHTGALGEPWCAIFANAMLEQAGIMGSRSPSSQSFRTNPAFVQLAAPAPGAITVLWRGTQSSGQGHVGFYRGEDATRVWVLGGNENDMVQIEALPKQSATFGLIGYWWPRSVPLPTGGPVIMPSGSPTSVQTPPAGSRPATADAPGGVQRGITATYFGGPQSAYGGPIDDNSLGVALPYHFPGDRPSVQISRNGVTIVCKIVDVGPWNTNDPYWLTGARPQAETGTDSRGRHTNKAGIDLTLAAATALQIDGKGLVDWQFTDSPSSPSQLLKVT
jgi:uncharacterized protein (TIGR02594 family)